MDNLFVLATRQKYRFVTSVGLATVEDLWDMPLDSNNRPNLNNTAKSIAKKLRESEEENFVGVKSDADEILENQLEIVKYIIKVKLDDKRSREEEFANKQKRQKILEIIDKKNNQALENLSVEELEKMIG